MCDFLNQINKQVWNRWNFLGFLNQINKQV